MGQGRGINFRQFYMCLPLTRCCLGLLGQNFTLEKNSLSRSKVQNKRNTVLLLVEEGRGMWYLLLLLRLHALKCLKEYVVGVTTEVDWGLGWETFTLYLFILLIFESSN